MHEGAALDHFYKYPETLHAVVRITRANCGNHRSHYYLHSVITFPSFTVLFTLYFSELFSIDVMSIVLLLFGFGFYLFFYS